jgi:tetratricopeptide (TPR) repeat protein
MPKRFSSTEGWIGFALKLARRGRCEEAQQVLRKLVGRELSPDNIRLAAQVNTRCELLDRAEVCWLEIERRAAVEPGDYYMLGSLQMRLSKPESAARCFQRELEVSAAAGSAYFADSSAIRLADLMLQLGLPMRAREALANVAEEAGDYIDGVGFRTKAAILRDVHRHESAG